MTELAAQTLVVEIVGTVGFASAGAFDEWQGWVGLGLALASWAGLVVIAYRAGHTDDLVERSLVDGLGIDYRTRFTFPSRRARSRASSTAQSVLAIPFRSRKRGVTGARFLTADRGRAPHTRALVRVKRNESSRCT